VPSRKNGSRAARRSAGVRQFVGKALRRGARRLDAAQLRLLAETPAGQGGQSALLQPRRRPEDGPPAVGAARESFFRVLEHEGDFASAAIAVMREYIECGASKRSRIFAQLLQREQGRVREAGDLCMAVLSLRNERVEAAWRLLQGVDLGDALRLAPVEYFASGFAVDPDTAGKALHAVVRGEHEVDTDAVGWFEIAGLSFATGSEDLSRFALGKARAGLAGLDKTVAQPLRGRIAWLEYWYGRAQAAAEPVPAPPGEIPIAVMSFKQPDRQRTARNLGDYLRTLATLGRLACGSTAVRFTGPPALVAVADGLRGTDAGAVERRPTVRLYEVDRDATSYAAVPDGTWLVVTGLLPQPIFGVRRDLPFNPRLRPIFLSVHVDGVEALTPETLEYLRRYGPVGCNDWSSVLLLQAAAVPAFFAGGVTAVLDAVAGPPGAPSGTLVVDVRGKAGDPAQQSSETVRTRSFVENLEEGVQRVRDFRGKYRKVITSQLETYLAARAAGADTEFVPDNPARRRLDGLLNLDDRAFAAMQQRIADSLEAVYGAILAGRSEDEVYAKWRDVTAPAVREAEAARAQTPPPLASFDTAAACATIRSAMVTVERSAPAPAGAEINVELSLDGNYKHQLEVVVDSIVEHASRPIRAFVLCRDHTRADYDRLAALFPTVSFVWLPTDAVDYGKVAGLISHTTVATLDRLLLPDLLPEVTRIIHHDLDALCLADLAELYDVDLHGTAIAGRTSPHPNRRSGYLGLLMRSERFRRTPEVGRDLIRRTHTRLRFDFPIFNAGIIVLDLERMRADGFCAQFLPYVERFVMHDQEVLNTYVGTERAELDDGWNWLPWLEPMAEPKVAHWAGDFKPWKGTWVVGRDLWRDAEARLAARYARAGLS
jgi:lipopolysaccharide biosynthesis glycosyltransferase